MIESMLMDDQGDGNHGDEGNKVLNDVAIRPIT